MVEIVGEGLFLANSLPCFSGGSADALPCQAPQFGSEGQGVKSNNQCNIGYGRAKTKELL